MTLETLDIELAEAEVSLAANKFVDGKFLNVHLMGFKSKNVVEGQKEPYIYTTLALQEAVAEKVYDGLDVYLGHPPKGFKGDRDPKDKVGFVEETSFDEAVGIKGNVKFNTAHPYYESVKWWAENHPERLSFSPRSATVYNKKTNEVVKIRKGKSIDVVSNGATTNGLFSEGVIADKIQVSEDSDKLCDIMNVAANLFYEARYPLGQTLTPQEAVVKCLSVANDLVAELKKLTTTSTQESTMEYKDLNIANLKAQRPDLVTLIASEAVTAETKITTELEEAVKDLPESARSKTFMTTLRKAKLAGDDIADLVADRKSLVAVDTTESVGSSENSVQKKLEKKQEKTPVVIDPQKDILARLPK